MAISVFFRLLDHTATSASYEVRANPGEPDQTSSVIELAVTDTGLSIVSPESATIGQLAAVSRIAHRRATEGDWPRHGSRQS